MLKDHPNTLNNKGQTDIIFLHFNKAFDKISHKLLLSKNHYGIRNHTPSWIGTFLSNRTKQQFLMVHTQAMLKHWSATRICSRTNAVSIININDINNAIASQIKLFGDYSA